MGISFAITAYNEHEELDRLLNQIIKIVKPTDELIIQLDSICNKICLCIGWSSILCLFGGLLFVIIKKKFDWIQVVRIQNDT